MKKNGKHQHVKVASASHATPELPSHIGGVRQGNAGLHGDSRAPTAKENADAHRSTGIAPEDRAPIDPSMPKLSPA